jgi:hypothetical protein
MVEGSAVDPLWMGDRVSGVSAALCVRRWVAMVENACCLLPTGRRV